MSELLKKSIETLSSIVNVSAGATHALDTARTKGLFKALHAEGEHLSYDVIKNLALENHWSEKHADDIAKLAQRIGDGGRVRIEHVHGWGESTVARLKEEISTKK